MKHERRYNSVNEHETDRDRGNRKALLAAAVTAATVLGIGGAVSGGKDIFKDDKTATAREGARPGSEQEQVRLVDELLNIQYGDFAASGDPTLFIDVDQALTVQINGVAGESAPENGDTDIQFVVAQLPEGQEPTDATVFSNAFVYDDDGVPVATQTVDQLTGDNGGRFNVTVPVSDAAGPQHVYIVPMQVGEAMDPSELITDNHVEVPFSFDEDGQLDLSAASSRG